MIKYLESGTIELGGLPPAAMAMPTVIATPCLTAPSSPRRRWSTGIAMPRAPAAELTEAFQFVKRHGQFAQHFVLGIYRFHAGQVQQ